LIFIDTSGFQPSQDWRARAKTLTDGMLTMTDQQRRDLITRHSALWGELKGDLERLSHCKCWYCERLKVRDDFAVDHFRPKNNVMNEDGTKGQGYWYLAFDYTNYRVACDWCNTTHTGEGGIALGKQDQFPLDARCARAIYPNCRIENEVPLLLDPTSVDDPPLLWFIDTGEAVVRPGEGALQTRRVEVTTKVLHLNHIRIVEARKEIWRKCKRLIKRADKKLALFNETGSPEARQEYLDFVNEMKEYVKPTAEFSATARACFQGSRYYWVNQS